MIADYLIVGSGLTGAVIARTLADQGRSVLIVERRPHMGGNAYDETHPSGIAIHTYGPHFFRTNSDKLWAFVNRFARFRRFEAVLNTLVDGQLENWPVNASYIRRTIGENWSPDFKGEPRNFEEASLKMMPRPIYEKFIQGYSIKQWGVAPTELSANLAKRFDVREGDDVRLMKHEFQGVPAEGYAKMMEVLLAGIPVVLNCDYLQHRSQLSARMLLVFTGPIDEFFGFDLGRLKYRGQTRTVSYLPDVDWNQPCVQVNNPSPDNGPHIRTIEWKHMMDPEHARRIKGTVLTREVTETPTEPGRYEYPFPDDVNARLYKSYAERAALVPGLLVCGRLGEYRYYDMDQAVARALVLAKRILDLPADGERPNALQLAAGEPA